MSSPAVITTVSEMRRYSSAAVSSGKQVALVPTMGAIHEGHLSTVNAVSAKNRSLVVSIFVNPAQFGPGEDFENYKRDTAGDIAKLSAAGVDAVFLPDAEEIYPDGFQTTVEVERLSRFLCGRFRPGHFKGVATVVLKLFKIVNPTVAGFGEKDFQQLAVVKWMVQDLNLNVTITAVPTVRDGSGLAVSSRNERLSDGERKTAVAIPRVLFRMKALFESGVSRSAEILGDGKRFLAAYPGVRVEYLEVCDPETLEPSETARAGSLAAIAAKVASAKSGSVRLIDSVRF